MFVTNSRLLKRLLTCLCIFQRRSLEVEVQVFFVHVQGFSGEGTSSANCDPHLLPWQQAQLVNHNLVCGPGANQSQLSIPGCSVPNHQTRPSLNPEEARTNNNDILHGSDNVGAVCDQCPINMEDIAGYDPELKEGENPHYFRVNSILYDAHVSRVTRTKSFHELNS